MSKRKQRNHTDADRLRYMHMMERGESAYAIARKYGIDGKMLHVLWLRYQSGGARSIRCGRKMSIPAEKKLEIVRDIEENHLTLVSASLKYGPSVDSIKEWLSRVRRDGKDALYRAGRRGRPPGMGRPKKDSKPLTELERLRKENQELRTQNALLKKVRALVEERNARLREIGRGPSKS